jgi:hypothetical protein
MSPENISIPLILWSVLFFGFVNTHGRQIKSFRGRSRTFLIFLNIYFIVSYVFGLSFLIYYGYVSKWYLPIILFAVVSTIGGVLFAVLDRMFGELALSFVGVAGIPVSGYFMVASLPEMKWEIINLAFQRFFV